MKNCDNRAGSLVLCGFKVFYTREMELLRRLKLNILNGECLGEAQASAINTSQLLDKKGIHTLQQQINCVKLFNITSKRVLMIWRSFGVSFSLNI